MEIDPLQIKRDSERRIIAAGGRTLDWLPIIERGQARTEKELINRALIVNALLNIHFKAPVDVIAAWISEHNLHADLSTWERRILSKSDDDLTEQDSVKLYWYIEALWALMWAGGLIDDLLLDQPVGDHMVTLAPKLERNEGPEKFSERMRLRSYEELFRMLDLYFRANWYARDGRLRGYATGVFNLDIIMERRRALEWLLNPASDWDNTNTGT